METPRPVENPRQTFQQSAAPQVFHVEDPLLHPHTPKKKIIKKKEKKTRGTTGIGSVIGSHLWSTIDGLFFLFYFLFFIFYFLVFFFLGLFLSFLRFVLVFGCRTPGRRMKFKKKKMKIRKKEIGNTSDDGMKLKFHFKSRNELRFYFILFYFLE